MTQTCVLVSIEYIRMCRTVTLLLPRRSPTWRVLIGRSYGAGSDPNMPLGRECGDRPPNVVCVCPAVGHRKKQVDVFRFMVAAVTGSSDCALRGYMVPVRVSGNPQDAGERRREVGAEYRV